MSIFTYPPDLRRSNISDLAYMKIKSFQYRDRNFVFDDGNVRTINPIKQNENYYYLPFPLQISNSNSLSWEMTDLKVIRGIEELFSADSAMRAIPDVLADAGAVVAGGLAKLKGLTANPKKQALFNGIEPRTFSFSWSFAPQSLKEAQELERMIKRLTRAALPSLTSETADGIEIDDEFAAFFEFPDEFEVEFINVRGFPKMYNLVCTAIQTNFSPGQMNLLESGHAVQIDLQIDFLETELLRKTKPGI